jgi:hypothetical protein
VILPLPGAGHPLRKGVQRARSVIVSLRPFALARSGNIQDIDLVSANKISDQLRSFCGGNPRGIDQQMWTLLRNTELNRLLRAALELPGINDHCPVRILNVLQSALPEPAGRQFAQRITIWNSAEFVQTPRRTPATAFDPVAQRDVERRAINAGLSAGNDFHTPKPLSRQWEQCPRAQPSKCRCVQARGCHRTPPRGHDQT